MKLSRHGCCQDGAGVVVVGFVLDDRLDNGVTADTDPVNPVDNYDSSGSREWVILEGR